MFQILAHVIGLAYLIGAPPPQSVVSVMPQWMVHAWAAGLLFSGLLSGVSFVARKLVVSLRIEQAAMLFGAASLVWAGYAVFTFAPAPFSRALLSGGLCFAWTIANIIRADQIRRDIKRILE